LSRTSQCGLGERKIAPALVFCAESFAFVYTAIQRSARIHFAAKLPSLRHHSARTLCPLIASIIDAQKRSAALSNQAHAVIIDRHAALAQRLHDSSNGWPVMIFTTQP
jgi:hypothetical protein